MTAAAGEPGAIGPARDGSPVPLPVARHDPFDPPGELSQIRGTAPLCRLSYPDGHVGWLATSYRLARAILADPRFSARSELKRAPICRPGLDPFTGATAQPGWFVDMDAPQHTRYRRLLAREFTVRRIALLEPEVEQIVSGHLGRLQQAGPPADLIEMFALPIPSLTICELLGVPYQDRADFQRDSTMLFSLEATAEEGAAAMGRLTDYMLGLVARKRPGREDDLLSSLVGGGELTGAEIAGACVLLLTAGHETISGMLGLSALMLLGHPGQLARLQAGPGPAGRAVEELLRYLTIFQFGVPRSALEDVRLDGRLIRAGETVTISLPAANRDPDRFGDPDELDLAREARGHLAFGYGMHQCLGQNLARMELRMALPALFGRLPGLRLAVPAEEVPLRSDAGFYGVHRLPVAW
jgi:cytochrome P450